jgi:hypothetical protein
MSVPVSQNGRMAISESPSSPGDFVEVEAALNDDRGHLELPADIQPGVRL